MDIVVALEVLRTRTSCNIAAWTLATRGNPPITGEQKTCLSPGFCSRVRANTCEQAPLFLWYGGLRSTFSRSLSFRAGNAQLFQPTSREANSACSLHFPPAFRSA